MNGFLFEIITLIGPTTSRAEQSELPLQLDKAFPTAM
jgi:hypothetical protein